MGHRTAQGAKSNLIFSERGSSAFRRKSLKFHSMVLWKCARSTLQTICTKTSLRLSGTHRSSTPAVRQSCFRFLASCTALRIVYFRNDTSHASSLKDSRFSHRLSNFWNPERLALAILNPNLTVRAREFTNKRKAEGLRLTPLRKNSSSWSGMLRSMSSAAINGALSQHSPQRACPSGSQVHRCPHPRL